MGAIAEALEAKLEAIREDRDAIEEAGKELGCGRIARLVRRADKLIEKLEDAVSDVEGMENELENLEYEEPGS